MLCIKEDNQESLRPVWDGHNNLKAVKVGSTVPLPVNAEQLRRRMAIMWAAWIFVASAHPTRPYLVGLTMQIWTEYCDILLGPFFLGMLCEVEGAQVPPRNGNSS